MRVSVIFSWSSLGPVGLDSGRLAFPRAPERPGIYRLDLGDRVYIGETDRLRRRFQHYRTPGPSQRTNVRLNKATVEVLDRGGGSQYRSFWRRLSMSTTPSTDLT